MGATCFCSFLLFHVNNNNTDITYLEVAININSIHSVKQITFGMLICFSKVGHKYVATTGSSSAHSGYTVCTLL
jgi:hypothetical protein